MAKAVMNDLAFLLFYFIYASFFALLPFLGHLGQDQLFLAIAIGLLSPSSSVRRLVLGSLHGVFVYRSVIHLYVYTVIMFW